jgi:hypothetical protein
MQGSASSEESAAGESAEKSAAEESAAGESAEESDAKGAAAEGSTISKKIKPIGKWWAHRGTKRRLSDGVPPLSNRESAKDSTGSESATVEDSDSSEESVTEEGVAPRKED